jgi:hypothetical protein
MLDFTSSISNTRLLKSFPLLAAKSINSLNVSTTPLSEICVAN